MKPNAHITTSPIQTTLSPVALFVEGHKSGLWHSARLLGGYKAAGRVDDIAERLAIEPKPSRRTLALLRDLHALLGLQNTHIEGSVEMGAFACIDPSDPVVEEICLLANGLEIALRDTLETPPQKNGQKNACVRFAA